MTIVLSVSLAMFMLYIRLVLFKSNNIRPRKKPRSTSEAS